MPSMGFGISIDYRRLDRCRGAARRQMAARGWACLGTKFEFALRDKAMKFYRRGDCT